jgi:hypothetical protein
MPAMLRVLPVVAAVVLLVGCGSSKKVGTASGSATSGAGPAGVAPLSGEAQSAATGDIPDNQVFLTYHDTGAGYSIQVPEGWARKGSGSDVTFNSKNNIVHIIVGRGALPTAAAAKADLKTAQVGATQTLTVHGSKVLKLSYSTLSAANPVTGKRVQLVVDRYVYSKGGKRASVDLGTPKGVDNVDAYKMMSRSFTWR